ncbi:MAG: beta-galactosidase [Halanaerobiaceae bacterium]
MLLATPYYPEHWPESRWEKDAKLMQEAGIKRIRMGEFAWHKMEPEPGQFEFDWLRKVIDLFAEYGIKTILCTPTPTYPAWLHKKYPDIHQVKSDGTVKEYGQRQDACKNHPGYRKYARRITRKMLEALGDHPEVVAWQTDNEFGCHGTVRCYCEDCEQEFRDWLRERFNYDIEALNSAWGTFFWSQDYNNFEEISIPRDTADRTAQTGQNPGLVLDFYRFSSKVQVEFQKEQVEIIRKYSPGRTITHNLMGLFSDIDYFELADDIDVVSWDNYPFDYNGTDIPPDPLAHDLMRGLKQQNVWVMEQASGPGGWGEFAATPQPGQMRLWAYQAVARGADMISFFRWRTCRFGREQYWHGILYHHGEPGRRYQEVKQIGSEFSDITEDLKDTEVKSEIGILYDYNSLWALEIQPNVTEGFNYINNASDFNRIINSMGLTADAVNINSDLDKYKVLICPSQHILDQNTYQVLKEFIENGGTVIFGPRSGVKDEENAVVNELLPGKLKDICGCHIKEYDAFSRVKDLELKVENETGDKYQAKGLAEVLVTEDGTEELMSYSNHYYQGEPAVVKNNYGQGQSLYLGTVIEKEGLENLLIKVFNNLQLEPLTSTTCKSIEVTRRVKEDQVYTFYLNHNSEPLTIKLNKPGVNILTGNFVDEETEIPGFGVMIIKES